LRLRGRHYKLQRRLRATANRFTPDPNNRWRLRPLVLSYRAAILSTGSLRAQLDAGSPITQTKLGLCGRHFVPFYWRFC